MKTTVRRDILRNAAALLALVALAGCASDGNRARVDAPSADQTPPPARPPTPCSGRCGLSSPTADSRAGVGDARTAPRTPSSNAGPPPRSATSITDTHGSPDADTGRGAAAAPETPPATLLRCTLLIPLRYNDGAAVPDSELRRIEDRLLERFDGYTIAGRVRGAYRMADGTRAEDESLVVWVAVPQLRVAELREEAARIAGDLRQESIYFEHGDGIVEFVPAPAARS